MTRNVTSSRGGRLWQAMNSGAGLTPPQVVLLEEACRIADRLDRLDAMLRGNHNEWLRIDVSEDGGEAVVIVDKLLSETRMQETALKGIVTELRQATEADSGAPSAPAPTPTAGGGTLVDLRAAAAARRASSAS